MLIAQKLCKPDLKPCDYAWYHPLPFSRWTNATCTACMRLAILGQNNCMTTLLVLESSSDIVSI